MEGQTVSHYRILKKIGQGGMGEVYLAEDTRLDRKVALKFLPEALQHDAIARKRFLREAKSAAGLDHPFICKIYETRTTDDRDFIVMEYVEGRTLQEKLALDPMPVKEALRLFSEVTEALDKAHNLGIVHRDLKPSNILVTSEGHPKVTDFGMAKQLAPQGRGEQDLSSLLTLEGATLGTPAYMSPEQIRALEVDQRSDIFSLGITFHEMLTGQHPFLKRTDFETASSILFHDPPKLEGVPVFLEDLVKKMMEKDPGNRYQSIRALRKDLQWCEERLTPIEPGETKGRRFRLVHLAALLLTLILIMILYRNNGPTEHDSSVQNSLTRLAFHEGAESHPTWSPDGKWIAYSVENGSSDIWKCPLSGGKPLKLTDTRYNETDPDWSPDGRNIVYSSDQLGSGIFVIPSDGGTPTLVANFGSRPTWSPDDKRLAFDSHGDIYISEFSRGEPHLLLPGTSAIPHTVWTPDASHLII